MFPRPLELFHEKGLATREQGGYGYDPHFVAYEQPQPAAAGIGA